MLLTTVFQLLACVAVPIAFTKFRMTVKDPRPFKVPFGRFVGLFVFLTISYFLLQLSKHVLLLSLVLHVLIFVIYVASFYRWDFRGSIKSFLSSHSVFLYLLACYGLRVVEGKWIFSDSMTFFILFFIVMMGCYILMIRQKNYFEAS